MYADPDTHTDADEYTDTNAHAHEYAVPDAIGKKRGRSQF